MPSNPKLYIENETRSLTLSLSRDLLFLPNLLIKNILLSYLAKAYNHYPVIICDFVFMGNHVHLTVVIKKPKDFASFLNYFKTNTGHAFNKLRGIQKGSVWEKGSDSPVILDMESLIDREVYLYSNPSKANVVSSIYSYNNLNTFDIFRSDFEEVEIKAYDIKRNDIPTINKDREQEKDYYKKLYRRVFNKKKQISFHISPKKAYDVLKETSSLTYKEYKNEVLEKIEKNEKSYADKRREEGISLKKSIKSIFINFIPHREKSHKMICLCSDIERRKAFIERFKYLVNLARECYQKWKKSHSPKYYPVGFFLPPRPPVKERTALFA